MVNVDNAAVLEQLGRILRSLGFANTTKLQRFLSFVVEHTLAGRESQIKESVIGAEVYQKAAGYDPRLDATVRVEATKLRQRLKQYYEANPGETLRISIPKGTYVAHFEHAVAEEARPPVVNTVAAKANRRPAWLLPAAGILASAAVIGLVILPRWPESQPQRPLPRLRQLTDHGSYAAEPAMPRR